MAKYSRRYGGKVGDVVVAKLEMRWSSWSCGGKVGDVVVKLELLWQSRRYGGQVGEVVVKLEMLWLSWR